MTGIVAIANGGTGANAGPQALVNLGAAAASHTHPYLSFSDANYPYFKDIEFHGSGNPLAWTVNFHPNTFWAIYIIEIRGGCHLGNRGGGGFVIKKGIIRDTQSSYSVFNIEENYYAVFYAGIIAVTSTSTNLIITINYPLQIDGRFTLLVSGGGLNTIQESIKPF